MRPLGRGETVLASVSDGPEGRELDGARLVAARKLASPEEHADPRRNKDANKRAKVFGKKKPKVAVEVQNRSGARVARLSKQRSTPILPRRDAIDNKRHPAGKVDKPGFQWAVLIRLRAVIQGARTKTCGRLQPGVQQNDQNTSATARTPCALSFRVVPG